MAKNKMEWYVFYHDSNKQEIIKWNIFNHGFFTKEVNKLLKEKLTKEEFSEKLRNKLMYYMWSRAEYEVVITPWVGQAEDEKVDIYDQVRMNWDRFANYVWSFRKDKRDE